MNNSGDVAEQVMRMSLEGTEIAVKLTGTGALKLAQVIYRTLKEETKTKGKARLTSMLRSGKALKVFTVKEEQLKRFSEEAKKYGVLYCMLRDKQSPDGCCDVMVRSEDASKINRIVDRFKIAAVDSASIRTEVSEKQEKTAQTKNPPEHEKPEKSKEDKLLDELMKKPTSPEKSAPENPFVERTERSSQSEPTSRTQNAFTRDGEDKKKNRPSVRAELKRIAERRRSEPKNDSRDKGKTKTHNKSNKQKER